MLPLTARRLYSLSAVAGIPAVLLFADLLSITLLHRPTTRFGALCQGWVSDPVRLQAFLFCAMGLHAGGFFSLAVARQIGAKVQRKRG